MGHLDRKSKGILAVKPGMRYVLLIVLVGLLVFLSNQVWLLFTGAPLF